MALVVADRVKETTTTTGTGAITLAGAETNFVTFSSVLSNADTTYYAIVDNTNSAFEVGLGTYASSGNTITRTTIISSSNSNNAVDLQAGSKDVFVTLPSNKFPLLDASGNVDINGGTIDGTTIGGSSAAAGTFTTFTSTGIDDNASSTGITIDSSQNVGINEASPDRFLHVNSGSETTSAKFESTGSSVFVQLTDDTNSAYIGADAGELIFQTPGSSFSTKMQIDSSGNVGIGATSPDQLLHLKIDDGAPHIRFERNDTTIGDGTSIGQIDFEHQESGNAGTCAKFGVVSGDTDGSGEFLFQTGLAGTLSEKVRIDKDGNVGINNASPSSKLEVSHTNGDVITIQDTNLTASSSDIGNVRLAWDDSAGTRVAYVGSVNSNEFWVNNEYANVVLSFAGSRKFETTSGGTTTTGLATITPTSGSVTIGPQNTSFCHFSTDRAKHYFNKVTHFDGGAVDYDTGDHFLLPNANNSELPNVATAVNGGAINYIYNRSSDVTLTRGDFAHHIVQQWSGTATFTLTDSSWQRGDIIEFVNVKGAVTITVVASIIYLPSGSNDTTLTLSQAGKFRLIRYSSSAGYWMVG